VAFLVRQKSSLISPSKREGAHALSVRGRHENQRGSHLSAEEEENYRRKAIIWAISSAHKKRRNAKKNGTVLFSSVQG